MTEKENFFHDLVRHKFFFFDESVPLVAIYDSFLYSRNDYDHLSPKQRKVIESFLLARNFTRGTRGRYISPEITVKLIKMGSLGVSPLEEISKSLEDSDLVFVTPLGYLLYGLQENISYDIFTKLVEKCPVNLSQAKDFYKQDPTRGAMDEFFQKLFTFQNSTKDLHRHKRM